MVKARNLKAECLITVLISTSLSNPTKFYTRLQCQKTKFEMETNL